jgi:2-polyprenyl-3-methyl-5-hydroxy-6-metoxy-1,4-benzoquinol methylase
MSSTETAGGTLDMSQLSDLSVRRRHAAESSGGISNDAIYAAIEQAISEKDLDGAVLDYGAGAGRLCRRLLALNRFKIVTGADLMDCDADLAGRINWVQQDLSQSLPNRDEDFDVVIAAEVIEHLENPRFTMREIFRVLRGGGWAIITTPNNESLRALLALVLRGHYVAFGDTCYPAHITALLRKDLSRIFQEAGFCEPEFSFSGEGSIPGLPSLTWQSLSLGLLRGLRFCDNIIAIAQKPGHGTEDRFAFDPAAARTAEP